MGRERIRWRERRRRGWGEEREREREGRKFQFTGIYRDQPQDRKVRV